ncbi:SID1 transmembrane family member 1-like [Montipora capricornis]|uniref:SID1 transmembrane family member 1-like n=1 Tax=Montipora capricornis TaxID=246305 RepID=UPI0035F1C6ED
MVYIIFISLVFFPASRGLLVLNAGSKNYLVYKNASLGNQVLGIVSRNREEVWLYEFSWKDKLKPYAVRVGVQSDSAHQIYPLLFVARLQRGLTSWTIPEEKYNYHTASRTLCPFLHSYVKINGSGTDSFSVDVSTSSPQPVNYTLKAEFVHNFEIRFNERLPVTVDPAQPVYFLWKFPDDRDTVMVKAESEDSVCAILSIQAMQCPVYYSARNVEFTGFFQSMTTKAAITIERSTFKQGEIYIVLVVKPSDEECISGKRFDNPQTQETHHHAGPLSERLKTVTITVQPTLSARSYVKAIAVPVAIFLSFYVIAFIALLVSWYRQRGGSRGKSFRSVLMPQETTIQDPPLSAPLRTSSRRFKDHYGSTSRENEPLDVHDFEGVDHQEHDHSLATDGSKEPTSKEFEQHYDMLYDIDKEKDIYRLRTSLMLTDLAKKEKRYLSKKFRLYHWNLAMIAVFYALPVVQLVITYQKVLNASGDEDICYYNFFCAHPLGELSAFNNVWSNVGYILLGFLFFLLVLRRDRQHKHDLLENKDLEKHYGIPQHFAIFYAMALALIMEGVLSGCYHVCPNNSNFQFDTSFMYIITCLGIVKLYQNRHPDIAANAHTVYTGFAAIILIAVMGVVYDTFAFWTTFAIIHIFGCLYLSSQIYYMGRIKFDAGILSRLFILLRYDCCSCPTYKDRMFLLLIANMVNWFFAIYGVATTPSDFATYLLAILIVNGLLYLAFYVIMKLRNKERILPLPRYLLVCTLICWILALIFFFSNLTSWQKSPARSREGNKECVFLEFYDYHDIWHFLSACALFFSFLGLLTLDDDLLRTPRHSIPVF